MGEEGGLPDARHLLINLRFPVPSVAMCVVACGQPVLSGGLQWEYVHSCSTVTVAVCLPTMCSRSETPAWALGMPWTLPGAPGGQLVGLEDSGPWTMLLCHWALRKVSMMGVGWHVELGSPCRSKRREARAASCLAIFSHLLWLAYDSTWSAPGFP